MKCIPIITNVSFFESKFTAQVLCHVSPRSFSSLTFRKSGKISVTARGNTIFSEGDSITYIPKGCAYSTEIFESGEMMVLHFDAEEHSGSFYDLPIVIKPYFPQSFYGIFKKAVYNFSTEGRGMRAFAAAYELLAATQELLPDKTSVPHPRLKRCKEYIDSNVCENLRIDELARLSSVSEVYFRREFKKYYGLSPLAYIKKKRIDYACSLLSTGLYSITEIAIQTGFESVSYFSYEFKRIMGCTPSEYKNFI